MSRDFLLVVWPIVSVLAGLLIGPLLYRRRMELERSTIEIQRHPAGAWNPSDARKLDSAGLPADADLPADSNADAGPAVDKKRTGTFGGS